MTPSGTLSIDMGEPNNVKQVRDQFENALIESLSDATGPSIGDFEPLAVDVDVTVTSQSDEDGEAR